jgi:hypothetical protein
MEVRNYVSNLLFQIEFIIHRHVSFDEAFFLPEKQLPNYSSLSPA